MATAYVRGILATQSRSTLEMQRFEPSILLLLVPDLFSGTSGGLIWGPLAASFGVSSLFFLLSSLFSPLSFCGRYGVRKGRFPSGGFISGPLAASWGLSALFSLLSSLCSLLSLLSSLFSRCRSFLRSHFAPAPCDLRIRPSTSPPTASTLCGSPHFSDRTSHLPPAIFA